MLLLPPNTRLGVVAIRSLKVLTMFCTDVTIDAAFALVGSIPTLIESVFWLPV